MSLLSLSLRRFLIEILITIPCISLVIIISPCSFLITVIGPLSLVVAVISPLSFLIAIISPLSGHFLFAPLLPLLLVSYSIPLECCLQDPLQNK